MKILKALWEMIKSSGLMTGLLVFVFFWLIALFLLWIYDTIFGGWHEEKR